MTDLFSYNKITAEIAEEIRKKIGANNVSTVEE